MYHKILVVIVLGCGMLLGLPSDMEAQKAKKKNADKLYNDLGYKASIPAYEGEEVDMATAIKIATAYRLNHDTENAELWYAQVIDKTNEPIHHLYYAQALQSNGKYDLAKDHYLKYDEMLGGNGDDRRGELLAAAIDRMNEMEHTEVELKNESGINSMKLEFSPTYYNNGIVFVSTSGIVERGGKSFKDLWIDDNFMALYYAAKNLDGSLQAPEEFSYNITTKYHEGPVSFSRNNERIYFTRNTYNNGKRKNANDGTMKLNIYTAFRSGDNWSDAKELPFCTDEHEEAHPSISADGQQLFFASDRPGGYGGMDIYVSNFNGGKWSSPQNLGPEINTKGNEVFPFIHDSGVLYYASNGLGGLGGLDIYSTRTDEKNEYKKPKNIGTPFNSKKDDFGFILNVLETEGYVTSARKGGIGKDDIYSFKMPRKKPKEKLLAATICTHVKGTDERIAGAEVTIVERGEDGALMSVDDDYIVTLVPTDNSDEYRIKLKRKNQATGDGDSGSFLQKTNGQGEFAYNLKPNREYIFVANKEGYFRAESSFSTEGMALNAEHIEFCIPMEKSNCMALKGQVINSKYKNRIPKATVSMTNLCTGEEVEVETNMLGEFMFPCVGCGCEFVLNGSKKNFRDGSSRASTMKVDCAAGGSVNTEIRLAPSLGPPPTTPAPAPPVAVAPTPVNPTRTYPANPPSPFSVGMVIELENIYYDFNKANIREGAAVDLDKVVDLMRRYPSLELELSSHTDSRGTDSYNRGLSQRRAQSAVNYIIGKGISRSRLVAKGYGEGQLRNGCANGVNCSEEEHQYNRRTEIKILRFDRRDISVKYIDNAPEKIDRANPKRKFVWE